MAYEPGCLIRCDACGKIDGLMLGDAGMIYPEGWVVVAGKTGRIDYCHTCFMELFSLKENKYDDSKITKV